MCCCRALWAQPGALASPALWGELQLGDRRLRGPARLASLMRWLARRRRGLRRLVLDFSLGANPPVLLSALSAGDCPLADLALVRSVKQGSGLFSCNLHLGPEASWRPLAALSALTRLDVSNCGLQGLPAALSGLASLADLNASFNLSLGGRGAASVGGPLAPLAALTALRALDLSFCGLLRLPGEFMALHTLEDLNLSDNDLSQMHERDLERLRTALASLTRLCACRCAWVPRFPAQLEDWQAVGLRLDL